MSHKPTKKLIQKSSQSIESYVIDRQYSSIVSVLSHALKKKEKNCAYLYNHVYSRTMSKEIDRMIPYFFSRNIF
jgi:hypothetical protein